MLSRRARFLALSLSLFWSATAIAQVMSVPSSGYGNIGSSSLGIPSGGVGIGLISAEQMTNNLYSINTNRQNRAIGEASSSEISKLDLKAPWKARREYNKGYQLLMRKDFSSAIEHLSKSTELYPDFVAAHNALGSAYLNLGKNDEARSEFSNAVALDDQLPNSHLNLGVAQLALKDYPAAEESLKKASSIAPMDSSLLRAKAYGQFVNKDYPGVLATTAEVHRRKHDGNAIVHYYAAGAWQAQSDFARAQNELETLLREDPKFSAADQVKQLMEQLKADQSAQGSSHQEGKLTATFSFAPGKQPTAEEASRQAQKIMQDLREKTEIAEAETSEGKSPCESCTTTAAEAPTATERHAPSRAGGPLMPDLVMHASVDEVAVFFAATDHGRSVAGLTGKDIVIRDDEQPPAAILGFRSEEELSLRLGLVVDTSDSVSNRFAFEQAAASSFLKSSVTGKDDLAFVVGVNNVVRLMQDFTADQGAMSTAIDKLVPAGGTALWDAVEFAADKLARRPETMPVSRIVVVVSDGQNNSSIASLKDAVEHAQHGEVAVYTVSTRDFQNDDPSAVVGEDALETLSELTGGAALKPGSLHRLKGSLADLQQLIRGRYMVSYKPASFQRDGRYRPIEIKAEKDGHKMKVFVRKGYYASIEQPPASMR
jgi:Ca-activated chloride channel family protein